MKTKKIIAFLLVLCLTLGSAACVFAADSQGSANAVTLEEFTGTIKVTNASGKDVSARNGMRLYSGYTVSTGTDSNAYIALDETKALMLESSSKTILKKSGGKIDVMLESGTVVVDVSKSLKKNQTLNVHTTNMVTGIRGTGVEVSYFSRISTTRICMLDGSTQNFNKFGLGEVQVVDAGHGIALGGGAATVEVLGDSIAVADLQPETQRLMVVDGGISGDVLEGFNEAFGTGELSEEDAAELQAAVGAAVEEQAAEQQAVEAAAEASAKDALTAETTGTAITNVDPVFEDQSAATGYGATMTEDSSSGDTGYVPADTGSSSSGDSGSSGDETLSSDAVTFTVPSGDNFASVMVFIDDVEQDSPEFGSSATYTATPSSVKFWICYEEEGPGFSVDNVTAKLGSTSLDVTSAPSQYDNVSGKFFAKSELPDNATLSAEIELTVEKINDDNASAVTGTLSSLASSQIFSAATVHYDSRDLSALSEYTKNSKFSFVPYTAEGDQEITITVPAGGDFFAVEVSENGKVLTGTSADNGTVYATTASSLRFTLIPATVNTNYYRISDIGANFPAGATSEYITGSAYDIYDVSDITTSFALTYDIGISLAMPDQNTNEQEYESTVSSLLTSLNSAPLFASRKLYAPSEMIGDDPTFNGLIDTNNVIVEPYYLATFVLDDRNTYRYEARDGKLANQPTTPQPYSYTDGSSETKTLAFKDWARINMDEPYVGGAINWIVYDPSEPINEDLVFYARFTDPDTSEVIVPATVDKP